MTLRRADYGSVLAITAAIAFITGVPSESSAVNSYQIKDLGLLFDAPDVSDSRPYSINGNGQVAMSNQVGGVYRALRYANTGSTLLDLGTLGGAEAFAFGINGSGQVVGRSLTSAEKMRAFVWTEGGTGGVIGNPQMRNLGTLGTGDRSEAYGINAAGKVVGYSDINNLPALTQQHAFLYSNNMLRDLGAMPGFPNTFAYSINATDTVVGMAANAFYTISVPFIYRNNRMSNLGTLGGMSANALAINDNDYVVGYSDVIAGPDIEVTHAFLHNGTTMTDLGTLGGNFSYAMGINNFNVVVGGSFVDQNDEVYHAFLYDGQMRDLNTLLPAVNTGWTLEEARSINDAGQIVGTGTLHGALHSFLLTPLSAPIPGDINLDGVVDRSDVAQFASHLGQSTDGIWTTGDYNIDGRTSLADLSLTQAHLGANTSSLEAPHSVPEPDSLRLAIALVLGLFLIPSKFVCR